MQSKTSLKVQQKTFPPTNSNIIQSYISPSITQTNNMESKSKSQIFTLLLCVLQTKETMLTHKPIQITNSSKGI